MKKVYLISWCDDDYEPIYWLNENYLGCDLSIVVKNLIDLQIPKGTEVQKINITGESFPLDDNWEQLVDYFRTIPKLDRADIRLIVLDKWEDFYKKNIKKIMRKVM